MYVYAIVGLRFYFFYDICICTIIKLTCLHWYPRYSEIYMQVSVCNVIRSVMEGKALVSLLADIVEDADQSTVDFLIMVIIEFSSVHFKRMNIHVHAPVFVD